MSDAPPQVDIDAIRGRIMELKEALSKNMPGYVTMLTTIHRELRNDATVPSLLSDEEIGVVCSGLQRHTNIVITEQSAKTGRTASGKKFKDLGLDDLD